MSISTNGTTSLTSGLAAGSAYTVAVGNQPSWQTCNLSGANSSVSLAGSDTTVNLTCTGNPITAYVVNPNATGAVSSFGVNPYAGTLAVLGRPIDAAGNRYSAVVDPPSRFLYAANFNGCTCASVYGIDSATGALTDLGQSASGGAPRSLAVDRSGKFVYVLNFLDNNVALYSINPATDKLTAVGTPVASGSGPYSVRVDPSSKFVYAANRHSDTVSDFIINPATGGLSAVAGSPFAAGSTPVFIKADASGKFVDVAAPFANSISAYSINTFSGVLTAIGIPVAAGTQPQFIAVDPGGKFAHAINNGRSSVSMYSINQTTGALTSLGLPFAVGSSPGVIFISQRR